MDYENNINFLKYELENLFKYLGIKYFYLCIDIINDQYIITSETNLFNLLEYQKCKTILDNFCIGLDYELEDSWSDPHSYSFNLSLNTSAQEIIDSINQIKNIQKSIKSIKKYNL